MNHAGERFLVTGALGFIGAWTVRALVRDGAQVTTFDLGSDDRRLRLIMTSEELAQVRFETGDITNLEALESALDGNGTTNVIHLAALQVPFCRADPPLGARVNVLGTVNVFEAVKRRLKSGGMAPVVYTSSIAMFEPADVDPSTGRLAAGAAAHPTNHYGVYKLANEGNARVYWLDDGVSSVALRPLTVYGVGRDQGMTSGPTKAIIAAVLGRPYTVPFRGPTLYQYAEDVARTLIAASRSGIQGSHAFNLPGELADGPTFLAGIEAALPGAASLITFDPVDLPFPAQIEHDGIELLGPVSSTPLAQGIRASVAIYQALAQAGRLDPAVHGLDPV